jgi:hypothetical protein
MILTGDDADDIIGANALSVELGRNPDVRDAGIVDGGERGEKDVVILVVRD